MRRLVFVFMLLSLLVGAVSAQLTRDWSQRTTLPDSGNNTLLKTALFQPTRQGQSEAIYSLSTVTMKDGRVVFQVVKRRRDGSYLWDRVVAMPTGNKKVWAKDIALDADGNVVVLAEIKQRPDFDLMVYRFGSDGSIGAKTLIRNKWQDPNWNIQDASNRAVAVKVTAGGNTAGDAFVLSSEQGDPANGPYTRVDKVRLDGAVEWSTKFEKPASGGYVGPLLSDPKALVLDSSGTAPFVLMQTVSDLRRDDMTVVSINANGGLVWSNSFGATLPNGDDDPIELEDIPIAMTSYGNGLYLVGNSLTYENRNGTPYEVRSETVFNLTTSGQFLGGLITTQRDSFNRPGQYNPRTITAGAGFVIVGGNVTPFSLRSNTYLRGFSTSTSALMANFVGPMGSINEVAIDSGGFAYAAGVEFIKKGSGFENKGVLLMVAPELPISTLVYKTNFALSTTNPGTQAVSVAVNGGGDVYVGSKEYAVRGDGNSYATATVSRFVQDPFVALMEISPTSVPGGDTFVLHVELSKRALAGGYKVKLSADRSGVVIPTNMVVPAGEDEWDFVLQTTTVSTTRTVVLTADPSGATASIQIFSGWVKDFMVSSNNVLGGSSLQGTVVLNAPAPSGGAFISLSTTSPNVILPKDDFIVIPAGSTQRTFNMGTRPVGSIVEVFVGATYNSTARAQIFVHPAQVTSFVVPSFIEGGAFGEGTITLSGPAPDAGLPVTIMSDSEALAGMTVVVPKDATSLIFRLNTMPVASDTLVHLTAKTSAASVAATVTVKATALKKVSADPPTVVGGTTGFVMVYLTALTPSGGESVSLSSNSPAATVQATALIPAGQSRVRVPVKTSAVNGTTTVEISVTHKGVTKTTTLTITAAS